MSTDVFEGQVVDPTPAAIRKARYTPVTEGPGKVSRAAEAATAPGGELLYFAKLLGAEALARLLGPERLTRIKNAFDALRKGTFGKAGLRAAGRHRAIEGRHRAERLGVVGTAAQQLWDRFANRDTTDGQGGQHEITSINGLRQYLVNNADTVPIVPPQAVAAEEPDEYDTDVTMTILPIPLPIPSHWTPADETFLTANGINPNFSHSPKYAAPNTKEGLDSPHQSWIGRMERRNPATFKDQMAPPPVPKSPSRAEILDARSKVFGSAARPIPFSNREH